MWRRSLTEKHKSFARKRNAASENLHVPHAVREYRCQKLPSSNPKTFLRPPAPVRAQNFVTNDVKAKHHASRRVVPSLSSPVTLTEPKKETCTLTLVIIIEHTHWHHLYRPRLTLHSSSLSINSLTHSLSLCVSLFPTLVNDNRRNRPTWPVNKLWPPSAW